MRVSLRIETFIPDLNEMEGQELEVGMEDRRGGENIKVEGEQIMRN